MYYSVPLASLVQAGALHCWAKPKVAEDILSAPELWRNFQGCELWQTVGGRMSLECVVWRQDQGECFGAGSCYLNPQCCNLLLFANDIGRESGLNVVSWPYNSGFGSTFNNICLTFVCCKMLTRHTKLWWNKDKKDIFNTPDISLNPISYFLCFIPSNWLRGKSINQPKQSVFPWF